MEFNLAEVHETVEAAVPERECIVFGQRRLTYHDVGDRTRRLANALLSRDLGKVTPRSQLRRCESGQDHLAVYLHNGNEFLEAMLGSYKARIAPLNVNFRYVSDELRYVLIDSQASAIVYHSALAPTLDEVREDLPDLRVLIQVDDDSGEELLEGAEWYEDVLAQASPLLDRELVESWSPDDLYILYTGGTTGMPKGVLWRQADIFVGALGGRRLDTRAEWSSLTEIADHARRIGNRVLAAPPFMHGAAHWLAFSSFTNADTLVIPTSVERFNPAEMVELIESESVGVALIVGDAFGRPLAEELESHPRHLDSLLILVSGGARLSAGIKDRLIAAVPTMLVLDGLGASETGTQASRLSAAGKSSVTGTFVPSAGMYVLSDDKSRLLEPGEIEVGWLGQSGRIPLGYLNDPERTASTFPTIGSVRYAVPGDRACLDETGEVLLFGREAATINSGGEKVFAEEVELAILRHPDVIDCVVTGRESSRWGQEVVAVIQTAPGSSPENAEIIEAAETQIARFKLPKAIVRVDAIERSPSGKADYRWARQIAAEAIQPDGVEP